MKQKIFILIRRLAYIALGIIGALFLKKEKGVIVFCYHSIANDSWRFSINLDDFKKQIERLVESRRPISIEELLSYIKGDKIIREPAFLLTFDDGYRDLVSVKSFLKKKGIKPVAFVLARPDEANREELDNTRPFLNIEEILELKAAGWEIGCHSSTHSDFSKLSSEELRFEIIGAKLELERELGFSVKYFAYPKGKHSNEITSLVKEAGYEAAFSMDNGYAGSHNNIFLIPRIGVDRTHTYKEFAYFTGPLVMFIRKLIN